MKKNKSTKKSKPEVVKLTKAQGLEAFAQLRVLHAAATVYYERTEKEISDLSSDLEKVQTELDEAFKNDGVLRSKISDLQNALRITNDDANKWHNLYIAALNDLTTERRKTLWTRIKEAAKKVGRRS